MPIASGKGLLRRCAAMQEYNTPASQSAANAFAQLLDYCWQMDTGFLAGANTAAPNCDFGPYDKGIMWTGTPSPNFPASWYTYDGAGVKVHSPAGSTIWIMNPTSTANYTDTNNIAGGGAGKVYAGFSAFFGQYLVSQIKARPEYVQTFADSMGTQSINGQVDPVTNAVETTSTWFPKLKTHMTKVQSIIHAAGFKVYPNGLITNSGVYNYGDGAMLENALRGPTDGALTTFSSTTLQSKFTTHGQRLMDTQTAGKAAFPLTEIFSGSGMTVGSPEAAAWLEYVAACAYIFDLGLLYWDMNIMASGANSLGNAWNRDLGTPMVTKALIGDYLLKAGTSGNLYGRRYLRGFVLVNTASGGLTYTLPRSVYKRIDGSAQAASITVPARSGIVLYATTDDPGNTQVRPGLNFGVSPKPRSGRNRSEEMDFLNSEIGPNKFGPARIYNNLTWPGPNIEESALLANGHKLWMSFGSNAGSGSVPYSSIPTGAVDTNIDRIGAALIAAGGSNIVVSYNHEPESSVAGYSPLQYAAAYAYIIDRWRAMGVTNETALILQGFTYNTTSSHYIGKSDGSNNFDPGGGRIQYYGVDAYNWYTRDGVWKTFATVYAPYLTWMTANHPTAKWAICEVATEEDPLDANRRAQWYADMLTELKKAAWTQLDTCLYFNSVDPTAGYIWYFDTTPESTAAMKTLMNDPFIAQFGATQPPPQEPSGPYWDMDFGINTPTVSPFGFDSLPNGVAAGSLFELVIGSGASITGPTTVALSGVIGATTVPAFAINGTRTHVGQAAEGLLMNMRTTTAIFDDMNPTTLPKWRYPGGGTYDPARQTNEYCNALPTYKAAGVDAVTISLLGALADPVATGPPWPWDACAFNTNGTIPTTGARAGFWTRLDQVLAALDANRMVAIIQLLYAGGINRLTDATAVNTAADAFVDWILAKPYRNVMFSIGNEIDNSHYTFSVDTDAGRIALLDRMRARLVAGGWTNPLVGVTYGSTAASSYPSNAVIAHCDWTGFSNNSNTAGNITTRLAAIRAFANYTANPIPILVVEDSSFELYGAVGQDRFDAAVSNQCSTGLYIQGNAGAFIGGDYQTGFQSVPTPWGTLNGNGGLSGSADATKKLWFDWATGATGGGVVNAVRQSGAGVRFAGIGSSAYANERTAGVSKPGYEGVSVQWYKLQPVQFDQYDTTALAGLDALVDFAATEAAAGRPFKFGLRIMAGADAPVGGRDVDGTTLPNWMTGGPDAQNNNKSTDYMIWASNDGGTRLSHVPIFWNPDFSYNDAYLYHYNNLMQWLNGYLNGTTAAGHRRGNYVLHVPVSAPTEVGSEMPMAMGTGAASFNPTVVINGVTYGDGTNGAPAITDVGPVNRGSSKNHMPAAVAADTQAAQDAWLSNWYHNMSAVTLGGSIAPGDGAWMRAIAIHMAQPNFDSSVAYGMIFTDNYQRAKDILTRNKQFIKTRLWTGQTNLRVWPPGGDFSQPVSTWTYRNWSSVAADLMDLALTLASPNLPLIWFQTANAVGYGGSRGMPPSDFQQAMADGLNTYKMQFLETYASVWTDPTYGAPNVAYTNATLIPGLAANALAVASGGAARGELHVKEVSAVAAGPVGRKIPPANVTDIWYRVVVDDLTTPSAIETMLYSQPSGGANTGDFALRINSSKQLVARWNSSSGADWTDTVALAKGDLVECRHLLNGAASGYEVWVNGVLRHKNLTLSATANSTIAFANIGFPNAANVEGWFYRFGASDSQMGAPGNLNQQTNTDAPVLNITSPTSGTTYLAQTTVTVAATASDGDGLSAVTVRVDGGAWQPMALSGTQYTAQVTLNGQAGVPTSHTIDVQAVDNYATVAQRRSTLKSITVSVNIPGVDTQAPVLTVTTPSTNATVANGVTTQAVAGVVTDNVGVTSLTVNGIAVAVAGDGSYSTSVPLVVGANTILVVAKDAAGNQQSVTRTITRQDVVVTNTPPTVTIQQPVEGSTYPKGTTAITLSGTVVDDGVIAALTYNIDGAQENILNLNVDTFSQQIAVTPGSHTITVTATDNGGLRDTDVRNVVIPFDVSTVDTNISGASIGDLRHGHVFVRV
jgi:hypothetical protein